MDKIKILRKKIDSIDTKIGSLLKKRFATVKKIGKIKKNAKIRIKDKKREKLILSKKKNGPEREVFKKILEESRKIQKRPLT